MSSVLGIHLNSWLKFIKLVLSLGMLYFTKQNIFKYFTLISLRRVSMSEICAGISSNDIQPKALTSMGDWHQVSMDHNRKGVLFHHEMNSLNYLKGYEIKSNIRQKSSFLLLSLKREEKFSSPRYVHSSLVNKLKV